MKKLILISLMITFFINLAACQKEPSNESAAQIQESVDRIKSRIQDDLNAQQSGEVSRSTDDQAR